MDAGKACDVVWGTFEEVYGRVGLLLKMHLTLYADPRSPLITAAKHYLSSEQTCAMFKRYSYL